MLNLLETTISINNPAVSPFQYTKSILCRSISDVKTCHFVLIAFYNG